MKEVEFRKEWGNSTKRVWLSSKEFVDANDFQAEGSYVVLYNNGRVIARIDFDRINGIERLD